MADLEKGRRRRRLPPEQPLNPVPPDRRRRARAARRHAGAWALAAAGALIAAGCTSGGAGQAGPGTTTGQTKATVPAPAGGPFDWARDTSPGLAQVSAGPSTTLAAVVPPVQGGQGWLAAGNRSADGIQTTATVWTSADASKWAAAALTGPSVQSDATAATNWKQQSVVVGSVGSGAGQRAAVWMSPSPGSAFASVPVSDTPSDLGGGDDSGLPTGASEMTAVTVGNLGYFATGTIGGAPAVWYSTNGEQWSLSAAATRFFGGLSDPHVYTVLATANLVFAAGSVRSGSLTDAAVWSTQDGLNWRSVNTSQGVFSGTGNQFIDGLAPLGTGQGGTVGILAVGGLEAGGLWSPASWISPDGLSWSQPSAAFPRGPAAAGTGEATVRAVSAVATLAGTADFVAAGGSPEQQELWQSSDGMRWAPLPLPAGIAGGAWRATLVASDGPTTVVADGDPGQAHLLVDAQGNWSQPSADPSVLGPVGAVDRVAGLEPDAGGLVLTVDSTQAPQSIGPAKTTSTVLLSSDGVNWAVGAPPASSVAAAAPPAGATAAGMLGSTWVAVGTAGTAAAWTGADGVHWSSPVSLDTQPGVSAESPSGICTAGGALHAVGWAEQPVAGTEAAAWSTTDGTHWRRDAVTPAVQAGAGETMEGCIATPGGLEAYGATASSSGAPVPALWSSAGGDRWAPANTGGFGTGAPVPLTGLAVSGTTWVAVAGDGAASSSSSSSGWAVPDPAAAAGGVWVSVDSGSTWHRQDQQDPVWETEPASLDRVSFLGSTVVVAGEIDGRLAVWSGTTRS